MLRFGDSPLLKSTVKVLAISVAGTGLAHVGIDTDPFWVLGAANFAANVAGGLGSDALKQFFSSCFDRTKRPNAENNVVLRSLRHAQLDALREILDRFDRSRQTDPDKNRQKTANAFSTLLVEYLKEQQDRISALTLDDLADPTVVDTEALRRIIERAPADFTASLSSRHGYAPALNAFRLPAQAAMLAEVSANVYEDIPVAFTSLVVGGPDGVNGWFALFIRSVAKALRAGGEFERVWAAEQSAVIRYLVETANAKIDKVSTVAAATEASITAFKTYGEKLDAIAGGLNETVAILDDMRARLCDDESWLSVETKVSIDGWYRFAARNPRIPFIERDAELEALHCFLYSEPVFAWWIAIAPGGAGKTRLALELCYRANAAGWRVGFLRKSRPNLPVPLPSGSWRPSAPTLIIADYASEQIELVSALASRLAELPEDSAHTVRLLLLERQADPAFKARLLGSATSDGSRIWNKLYPFLIGGDERSNRSFNDLKDAALKIPELSDDGLWSLVRDCPWRNEETHLLMEREEFFNRFNRLDKQRRALVAMLLADSSADSRASGHSYDLSGVLSELIARERDHYWPKELRAKEQPIGSADADSWIACATMIGRLTEPVLSDIARALGRELPKASFLRACSRAVGSSQYNTQLGLDGIQPDLIGEYFALETLAGDAAEAAPYPLLPELLWHANEAAMAGFVMRAAQNFPKHRSLQRITIGVAGLPESWRLYAFRKAGGEPTSNETITAAICALEEPARTDASAAAVLISLATSASYRLLGGDPAWDTVDGISHVVLQLPKHLRASTNFRMALAFFLTSMVGNACNAHALARRDELLGELRDLSRNYRADAEVGRQLAYAIISILEKTKGEEELPVRKSLSAELRALSKEYQDDPWLIKSAASCFDAGVRKALFRVLAKTRAQDEHDALKQYCALFEMRASLARACLDRPIRLPGNLQLRRSKRLIR